MLKNRWLLIGLLLAMTACVAVVTLALLLPPTPGVTKENFDRIEVGMTRAEVEQILGGKPNSCIHSILLFSPEDWAWENEDTGDHADIDFDENDRVRSSEWLPSAWPDDRNLWDKLLDRFRRRDERPRRPII